MTDHNNGRGETLESMLARIPSKPGSIAPPQEVEERPHMAMEEPPPQPQHQVGEIAARAIIDYGEKAATFIERTSNEVLAHVEEFKKETQDTVDQLVAMAEEHRQTSHSFASQMREAAQLQAQRTIGLTQRLYTAGASFSHAQKNFEES